MIWKIMAVFAAFGMLFLGTDIIYADSCNLSATMVNQDPIKAIPGEYVDVLFEVSGVNNVECKGATFNIILEYPFSIDDGNTTRTISGSTAQNNQKTEWLVSYTLRVDKNAVEESAEIDVRIRPGSWSINSYIEQTFEIDIEDVRSEFDVVIQEIDGNTVSIAIANIGDNSAESVIAKVPVQSAFTTSGPSGQIVGNLDSGDYTVVSFNIKPTSDSGDILLVEIAYTDAIGERRIIEKEISLDGDSIVDSGSQESKRNVNPIIWISIAILIIVSVLYIRKRRKNGKNDKNGVEPKWISSQRSKKKK